MNKKKNKTIEIFSEELIEAEVKDYLENTEKEMFKIANKSVLGKKCKKCGKFKKLKIVPLYNDQYPLPTEIILYCGDCHNNETIILRNENKRMIHCMEHLYKMVENANILLKKLKK